MPTPSATSAPVPTGSPATRFSFTYTIERVSRSIRPGPVLTYARSRRSGPTAAAASVGPLLGEHLASRRGCPGRPVADPGRSPRARLPRRRRPSRCLVEAHVNRPDDGPCVLAQQHLATHGRPPKADAPVRDHRHRPPPPARHAAGQEHTCWTPNVCSFCVRARARATTLSRPTALENITLPSALAGKKHNRDWLQEVVTALGLSRRLGHTPSELSGGQQERVAAARALLHRPQVVFADEPTDSLDQRSSRALIELLQSLVRDFGTTFVVVTHDRAVATAADNRVRFVDGVVKKHPSPGARRLPRRLTEPLPAPRRLG